MQVTCESCDRVHEIPDQRIPLFGARLRCASCGRLFEVPPREELLARTAARRSVPPWDDSGTVAVLAPVESLDPGLEGALGVAPEPSDATRAGADPEAHEAARRLARMLIADIAYADGERLARARREGRVLAVFAAEVAAAHRLYRTRVGDEIATGAPYFRDALMAILGKR